MWCINCPFGCLPSERERERERERWGALPQTYPSCSDVFSTESVDLMWPERAFFGVSLSMTFLPVLQIWNSVFNRFLNSQWTGRLIILNKNDVLQISDTACKNCRRRENTNNRSTRANGDVYGSMFGSASVRTWRREDIQRDKRIRRGRSWPHSTTRTLDAKAPAGPPRLVRLVVVLGSYGRFSVVHQSRESYFKANPHAAPSSLSVSGDKALRCAISTCLLGVGSSGPAKVKDCSSQVILPGLGKPKTAHRLSIGDNLS